jgi:hypothetical protein
MVGRTTAPAAPAREDLRNCRRETCRCSFITFRPSVGLLYSTRAFLVSPIAQRMPPRRC